MAKNRPPAQPNGSWADKVRVTDASMCFSLEKLPKQPQGSRLQIPHEMIDDSIDDSACIWTRCLVGFFPGARLPFTAVRSIVNRVWKQFGLEQVMTTTNGFMLFRFKEEEGLHTVVERGPWVRASYFNNGIPTFSLTETRSHPFQCGSA
ncbi:hypothetical protein OIU84_024716 [Salix udensis]|uniref:DUF4283 domain-containing protein n=1 Tax=Salix udensis TaxID=889485 RepID=A0AAD6PCU4_9ROSI|nr:hypothetical protein OIU84_024716 [Salix udensis]